MISPAKGTVPAARLLLNYKEIPYKTIWIEYPDITPTFKSLGITPNPTGIPYTIPTIRLPDSTYHQDSYSIASTLDASYPDPSLKITSPHLSQVEDLIPKLQLSIRPLWMPLLATELLNDSSRAYFEETRKERIGMPISDGPFIEGNTPSYPDFFIVATLHMMKRIDAKILSRLVEMEEALGKPI
ncbi:hypothetical protein DID88_005362 [Monilinia fructigena]|uniref:GST N-terminal domain-containing protein n=1 Tax=Monilinia fructigena TaxID=38457 RepID=A0A395J0S4_9HELO|nr:hypothetical protein DID88_005362 [Monilinia fructigena]